MIGWIAAALAWAALIVGWNRPRSRAVLLLWCAALIALLIADAWSVTIALYGIVVGARGVETFGGYR